MADYDETDSQIATLLPEAISTAERQRQILLGNDSASTPELHYGWPFRENSLALDCALWATRRIEDENPGTGLPALPPAVQRALKAVAAKPCFETITALRKAAAARRPEWSGHYNARLDEIVERCDIYLWHLGDADAADRCAIRALDRISSTHRPEGRDGLLRTALTIAGMSVAGADRLVTKSAWLIEMRARAGSQIDEMKSWLSEWSASQVDAAEKPKAAAQTAFVKVDDVDLPDVLYAADDDVPTVSQMTLVVVPSLEHLPKPSLGQRDRRDTPRAEFARIEGKPLPLKSVPSKLFETLLMLGHRFPWMRHAFDAIGQHLAYTAGGFKLPPICLEGGPGSGKTSAAIEMLRALDIPSTVYSAAGVSDSAFGGTSRQWTTGRASVPLQAILMSGVANPVIIVDEIEKTGDGRHNGAFSDVLLPMTEPTSARAIFDPYLECSVDLSAVSFLATSNDASRLSGPLRDRFKIVSVPSPGPEHVPAIVQRIVDDIRASRGNFSGMIEDLAPDEIELLARDWKPGSMRGLRRAVETVLATRDRLATRN